MQSDFSVDPNIDDTISSIKWRFSESAYPDLLSIGSWDGKIRLYNINCTFNYGVAEFKVISSSHTQYPDPVTSICWTSNSSQATTIVSGCGDGSIRIWDAQKNQNSVIGKHAKGIAKVEYVNECNFIMAMSYNDILALWDPRSNKPAMQLSFGSLHPLYLTYFYPFVAVLVSENKVVINDFETIKRSSKLDFNYTASNKLKKFYTSFEGFIKGADAPNGFAIGSLDGRIEIKQFIDSYSQLDVVNEKMNYTFKAHGVKNDTFAVNSIAYNKKYGTLISGGAEGTIAVWDKIEKIKIKEYPNQKQKAQNRTTTMPQCYPVTASDISSNGLVYAYGCGYDWSMGCAEYGCLPNELLLHAFKEDEVKRRPPQTKPK